MALEATRLLLSYAAGKPEHTLDVRGSFQHAQFVPMAAERLAQLSNEELAVLGKLRLAETPARD